MRALLVAAFICLASTASAQTLVGLYTLVGTNPDGKTYSGIVEIAEQGSVLVLNWELAAGETADGYAFLDGDMLTYICRAVGPHGVALAFGHYKLNQGKLRGKWSSPGQPEPGSEVLTPSKKSLEQLRKELKEPKAQV